MRMRLLAGLLLLFLNGYSQVMVLKSPRQLMEKGKWKPAFDLFKRNLSKDSLDVVSQYGLAVWYASVRNPDAQVDSAYRWAKKSLVTYSRKNARERDRLRRDEIDSARLASHKLRVDSLGFERARTQHTVAAYHQFAVGFPDARQVPEAIELRNELAYAEALRLNTEMAYANYLAHYPGSAREADARGRLYRLQFERASRVGTLEAFHDFWLKYPENPFRTAAEKHLFEISTADGEPEHFLGFINDFPASRWSRVARDFLFHLKPELPDFPWTDSLRLEQRLNEGYLLPFAAGGKIGFVNERGDVVVPAQFADVTTDYLCGPVTLPILVSPSAGVFSRQLRHLTNPSASVQWLSTGHFLALTDSTGELYHASGRLLLRDVEEVELVESFLAFRQGNKWGVISLTGVELMPPAWEQVQVVGEFIVTTRMGKRHIFPLSALAAVANRQLLPPPLVADDFRQVGDRYHVRNGALEGVVDARLNEIIPLDRQQLTLHDQLVVMKKERYAVRGFSPVDPARSFDQLLVQPPWLKAREGTLFHLYHMPSQRLCLYQADSVWFARSLTFARKDDSLHLFFAGGQSLRFPVDAEFHWVTSADSVGFFYTVDKLKKQIFDIRTGERLFATEADQVQSLGGHLIIIRNGKKGLLTREGKVILSPEYDHFVLVANNRLSLLKDQKFGLYDFATGRVIKPVFERNLIQVTTHELMGFSQGKFGFVSWDSRTKPVFEFDDVVPWSDSLVWVKQDQRWKLLESRSRRIVLANVQRFSILNTGSPSSFARFDIDEYNGLFSTQHGMVLAPTYHAIELFVPGSSPVFRAEKNVEEAGIYIVMYFNERGKLIYRMALEEVDYERLYCDD